jgi:hypothetical protein
MDFGKERSKLLELKAEYCLDDFYVHVYKKGRLHAGHASDYLRGKQKVKMINLLLDWGKIGYRYSYDGELFEGYRIDLSHKDEKFIRKCGIEAKYDGKVGYDWLLACLDMGLRDDIYGHMVKIGAFDKMRDEKVRNWTIMGLLAGYAHIAPQDPMIEEILSKYDEKSAPTDFVKLEQSRGLKQLENGEWERWAKCYHYMNAKSK